MGCQLLGKSTELQTPSASDIQTPKYKIKPVSDDTPSYNVGPPLK